MEKHAADFDSLTLKEQIDALLDEIRLLCIIPENILELNMDRSRFKQVSAKLFHLVNSSGLTPEEIQQIIDRFREIVRPFHETLDKLEVLTNKMSLNASTLTGLQLGLRSIKENGPSSEAV